MKSIKLLERTYFSFLLLILLLVVFTPYIIRSGFLLFEEESLEVIIIILLFGIGYIILRLYQKEVEDNLEELERAKREKQNLEDRLTDAFKYIGSVNVQIQEIRSVFSGIKKLPENKKDLKYILQFFAGKILGIVNVDWVILRIVDTENSVTLREHSETRGKILLVKHEIGNSDLLANKNSDDYKIINSSQENFHIKTFCLLPNKKINQHQEDLIRGIINQLEMLFIIFSSNYYKDSRLKTNNNKRNYAKT